MTTKQEGLYLSQLQEFLESKGITSEEAKQSIEEVLVKAFEKDKDSLSRYDELEDPTPGTVNVDLDLATGKVSINREKMVVEEKTIVNRFNEIEFDDEAIADKGLKIGELYVEEIDLAEIGIGKTQHIKQLFLQKISEIEKSKLYAHFSQFKGELLTPTVHNILTRGNVILDYHGDSIFMPGNESSPLDRDKVKVGQPLTIYVLEIEELSKDAQIIASRKSPLFVAKLIEREIDDVQDGVVKIESIAREAGFKTKVAVSSTLSEVDPVGSIIGVKGQKIKPIVDEIGGERLDVIKFHDDLTQFIAEALLPAKIRGVNIETNEDGWREAVVVVDQEEFLPALGKRGINIKLAAILTRTKLDLKTVAEAKEEGIEWTEIVRNKFVPQNLNAAVSSIEFSEFESVEDLTHNNTQETFSEEDYGLTEDFGITEDNLQVEEEYDDTFDEYDEEGFDN